MSRHQDNRPRRWPCNENPKFPLAFCWCPVCEIARNYERAKYGQGDLFSKPEMMEVNFQ